MDTYGYFYNVSFDPSYPFQNLIASNDDSAGNRQFWISLSLQSGHRYILVVTTSSVGATGSFTIKAAGPSSVMLTSITPSTNKPTSVSSKCISYNSVARKKVVTAAWSSTEKRALFSDEDM